MPSRSGWPVMPAGLPSAGSAATPSATWARPARCSPCGWRPSSPRPTAGGTRACKPRTGPPPPNCPTPRPPAPTCWRRWRARWSCSTRRRLATLRCISTAWPCSMKTSAARPWWCRPRPKGYPSPSTCRRPSRRPRRWCCLPRRGRWAWGVPQAAAVLPSTSSRATSRPWCPSSRSMPTRSAGRSMWNSWPTAAMTAKPCGTPLAGPGCRGRMAGRPGAHRGMWTASAPPTVPSC